MQDFKRLVVWQKSHALYLASYRELGTGRSGHTFGLRTQLLRAAASIPANIAEGCGKPSTKEFIRFLGIALGSARELENHLIAARDLEILEAARFDSLNSQLVVVQRMLIALMKSLRGQEPRA